MNLNHHDRRTNPVKFFLLLFVLTSIFPQLRAQSYAAYTIDSFMEMIGRSIYSPVIQKANADLNFDTSDKVMYIKPISLSFSNEIADDDPGMCTSLGIFLEELKYNDIPMLEDGFLGMKAYMSRGKADKILLSIDPTYENDGKNHAWISYKEDYRIKVQFTGEKKNSQLLRIYVVLKEDKYSEYLKKDFQELGPKVLIPAASYRTWESKNYDQVFINVLPVEGCDDCLLPNSDNARITFPHGSVFEGQITNYLGTEGTLTFKEGGDIASYEGSFKNGLAEGKAILTLADGQKLNTRWREGSVCEIENFDRVGYIYTGEVNKNFLYHGKGSVSINGVRYEGVFINDKPDTAKEFKIISENAEYRGGVNENLDPHGQGVMTYKDGQSAKGLFSNGQFQGGSGTVFVKEGLSYTGEMDGGMNPAGRGRYNYANGNYVDCITKDGVFSEAEGKLSLDDGSVYQGKLNGNIRPHGAGRIEGSGGTYIEGEFSNDQFLGGKGSFKLEDGSKYEGEIDADRNFHGQGFYTYSNNMDQVGGKFSKGKLLPGYGYRKFADGSSFTGELDINANPNGQGTAYGNGYSITGYFYGQKVSGSVLIKWDSGESYEGPVDESMQPHGTGKFRRSSSFSWESGTFSHGQRQ